jgi:hypothetical protein
LYRYEISLEKAKKAGIKKGLMNGLIMGMLWLTINGGYALGFWLVTL